MSLSGKCIPTFTVLLIAYLAYFYPTYGRGYGVIYERGWVYLGFFIAILAGYGIAVYFGNIGLASGWVAQRFKQVPAYWMTTVLWIAGVTIVALALITGIITNETRDRYLSPYQLVDDAMVSDLKWMGQSIPSGEIVAIGNPEMSWVYTPIAGPDQTVLTSDAAPFLTQDGDKLRSMLASGSPEIEWLRESGATVLYTCQPSVFECVEMSDPDLLKVRKGVYLVTSGDDGDPDSPKP